MFFSRRSNFTNPGFFQPLVLHLAKAVVRQEMDFNRFPQRPNKSGRRRDVFRIVIITGNYRNPGYKSDIRELPDYSPGVFQYKLMGNTGQSLMGHRVEMFEVVKHDVNI